MTKFSWADDGEEEINRNLLLERDEKVKKRKLHLQSHIEAIETILNTAEEFCQIGLVLYMIAHQKTINLYRDNKEDREYGCSLLMNKAMKYLYSSVKIEDWTDVIKYTCELFEGRVKGSLILKAKTKIIKTNHILSLRFLEKNHMRNRKLYFEKKGYHPLVDYTSE